MPAGFQSFNDSGTVQIDDTYPSLILNASPVITVSSGSDTTLNVSGANPMLFLGQTNGAGVCVRSRVNIGTNLWRYTLQASSTVNVRVYIFDYATPYASNFGMQVFNASGTLIFDSNAPFFKMVAVYQVGTIAPQTFYAPSDGRTYAAALTYNRLTVNKKPITHAWWDVSQEGLWISGTALTVDSFRVSSVGGETSGVNRPNSYTGGPQILVVDVTNF